ncbi:hypothetical protein BpHYR1_020893 [Brachionus plicatilis]|uniref:Uncharacterized protein n=1 Tax=Brachionus plicatilis TaxID=10195 RepID=A0A3M7RWV0_BRAPC|nr:hypothetical protein BpHYR1_020893 [Brachionus plicatilis]
MPFFRLPYFTVIMAKYREFTKIAALWFRSLKSLLNRNQEFNDFLKNASEYEDSSRYTREKQFSIFQNRLGVHFSKYMYSWSIPEYIILKLKYLEYIKNTYMYSRIHGQNILILRKIPFLGLPKFTYRSSTVPTTKMALCILNSFLPQTSMTSQKAFKSSDSRHSGILNRLRDVWPLMFTQSVTTLTSEYSVSLSWGNKPLASSNKKSLRINFLKPQSLPCTNLYAR